MLHRYRFHNFYSFREDTEVSLELSKHVPDSGSVAISPTGKRLSKVAAVIGPNAGGKTNLIKPIAFLHWFVSASFQSKPDAPLPFEPHFFAEEREGSFEVYFDTADEGKSADWRYEVTLTGERVLHEALYRRTSRLYSHVFVREWDPGKEGYRIRQQGFGFSPREADKVRPNASLIATAAQYNVPLARRFSNPFIYTNVGSYGRYHFDHGSVLSATEVFSAQPNLRERMNTLLRHWDLGLAEIDIRKVPVHQKNGEQIEMSLPFAVHRHRDRSAEVLLMEESSGTQGAYALLAKVLPALESGGLVGIDELEADLHPHMLVPILGLFLDPATNPRQAQIVFTCHAPEVLNLLHKSQVFLVEKDDACTSHAWRLDTVQGVRNDDNLYAKYMAGAYGAIPDV